MHVLHPERDCVIAFVHTNAPYGSEAAAFRLDFYAKNVDDHR